MNVLDFDYDLPSERIAQRPLAERDASRMLVLDRVSGAWSDRQFRDFPELLRGDELVVINNVKVLPARLLGRRKGLRAERSIRKRLAQPGFLSASIEVLLVRQVGADTWETLVRPGRKVRVGEQIVFGDGELEGLVEARGERGLRVLRFTSQGGFHEAVGRLGHIPLPPYIRRADDGADRERYQTIFARQGAAVAAPTAGLHFTPGTLQRLRARGIEIAEITLDVGLGTFEPVRTEQLEGHKIHAESYEIPPATAAAVKNARRQNRPVLAVGTTVVRALEDGSQKQAGGGEAILPGKAEANIFLYPGRPFRCVDQLLTNFHLPRSTLLAMVAAFAGRDRVLRAYRHAVESGYRFYSYGDSMFIR
jgi:S-adenosylmethionine:tRNA ribosyltransferase-isomerase